VLRRQLPELELHNALGVLEMTARSPETRELYEARLKVKRDEKARLDYARSEGIAKGRAEGLAEGLAEGEQIGLARGEKIGQIRLLERLLRRSPTNDAELAKASLQDLAKRLDALHQLSH
jgi:flagellar biosynthesis/type III secretory pathway protein FliH